MSSRRGRGQIILAIAMAVLAVAALRDLSRLGPSVPWQTMDDFPDFYCAGWVVDRRASPYTYEPLHACERRMNVANTFRGRLFARNSRVAFPAPLPAYDFLPFMGLARLSRDDARAIDAIAIVTAVALVALALAGLRVPLELSVAALALSTAYVELNTGQVVPFALAAVVLCGLALSHGRDRLAGIFAVFSSIEPTVGIPVIVATLCFVPRARWPSAATGGLFALLALGAVGGHALAAYALRVVPAQAVSEVHFPFQYSLTYLLAYLNLPTNVARFLGGLSYLVFLATGLWLAPRVACNLERRELLVFIPAFCCVIGGAYLHQEELCFALPALLVVTLRVRGRARNVFAAALCVLAIPWILVWGMKQLFLACLFVCSLILLRLHTARWPAIATLCTIALTLYAFELHPPHLPVPASLQRSYAPTELVQNEWRDYAEARSTRSVLWLAIKLPTWAALLVTLLMVVRCALRPQLASGANHESSHEIARRRPGSLRARMGLSGDLP